MPKEARWSHLRRRAQGLGELLNSAAQAMEDANPRTLKGVLAGIDFNDEHKLVGAQNRDDVLGRLLLHFSKLNLRNSNLSEPDILGRAYNRVAGWPHVWADQIDRVERLLIYSHKPAQNASGVGALSQHGDKSLANLHVLNWGAYAELLPEVSGARWRSRFEDMSRYGAYGTHDARPPRG